MTGSSDLKCFQTLAVLEDNALKKLDVLIAHLTAPLYKLIQEETIYERAIEMLQKLFVKPRNKIYARHLLATA